MNDIMNTNEIYANVTKEVYEGLHIPIWGFLIILAAIILFTLYILRIVKSKTL